MRVLIWTNPSHSLFIRPELLPLGRQKLAGGHLPFCVFAPHGCVKSGGGMFGNSLPTPPPGSALLDLGGAGVSAEHGDRAAPSLLQEPPITLCVRSH